MARHYTTHQYMEVKNGPQQVLRNGPGTTLHFLCCCPALQEFRSAAFGAQNDLTSITKNIFGIYNFVKSIADDLAIPG